MKTLLKNFFTRPVRSKTHEASADASAHRTSNGARPSVNKVLSLFWLLAIAVSVITFVNAAAPNPGHTISEIGNVVQGDLLYGSATDVISALAKNTTATRYLSNTGASNNPAWAQVDLTNGVTGSLPLANVDPIYHIFSATTASLTATTNCNPYGGTCAANAIPYTRIPIAMTLQNLYARMTTAPASGSSCQFLVQVANDPCTSFSATALTCTIVGNGSLTTCSDTVNTVSITAGQCIQMRFVETTTCTGSDTWTFEGRY